jgi:TolB-like protein/Flp pilus assembly protein TadD
MPGATPMSETPTTPITIDLTQFKLHIELAQAPALTLQFNSPSRRFYLSVIALVVIEMRRLGRITSIPLEEHTDLLGLLNETVGGLGGSSEREYLLPRIYRKWKDALPDLENAPLFKVLGRKRDYEEGLGPAYRFTEEQKDAWANLFEYRGSEEHVRLRFSIDKLGMGLDEVVITYGEDPKLTDDAAWEAFIAGLHREEDEKPEPTSQALEEAEAPAPLQRTIRSLWHSRWRWPALAAVIAIVAAFAVWQYSSHRPYEEIVSSEKMAFPLPDKPSIAVLPFVNMSGDPDQEYFSDGITEQIITCLSKVPKLFVIARNSTFTYKGRPEKVQQVSRELGVRYVMEGSVYRSGDRIRFTAQLIDAITGHHLWAERYDRDLKDVFALQDEITMKIITALEVKLTEGEQALVTGSGTNNLDAYLKVLQARELKRHQTIEANHKARLLVEQAIEVDPDYAQAYRWLSGTHLVDVWLGSTRSPRESLKKAVELATKAISLDDSLGGAHGLLGNIYIMKREYDNGIMEAERAVELEPNGADAHAFLGMGLRFADRAEEAIPILHKAIRLDPHAPGWYLHNLASAYRNVEKYEEATQWVERAVQQNPENVLSRTVLCSIYGLSGRMDEARAQANEIMRLNPNFSLERLARTNPQKNQVLKQRYTDALRKAGLK